jgi:hypothetical protein
VDLVDFVGNLSTVSGSILISCGSYTAGMIADPSSGARMGGLNAAATFIQLMAGNISKIILNGSSNEFYPLSNNTVSLGKSSNVWSSVFSRNAIFGPGDVGGSDFLRVSGSGKFSGPVTASAFSGDGTNVTGILSSSYALSASWSPTISASYALSASFATTASAATSLTFIPLSAITASYIDTASYANSVLSASYALSASYSDTTLSASYSISTSYAPPTASNGFRVRSDVTIDTGSLLIQSGTSFIKVTSDVSSGGLNKINSSGAPLTIQINGTSRLSISSSAVYPINDKGTDLGLSANAWKGFYLSGPQVLGTDLGGSDNMRISGSAKFSGPVTASAFLGDGTKVTGVISSSYALTSSYALSSSYVAGNNVSGTVATATSSSYALSSSFATTASAATSLTFIPVNASSASVATTSSYSVYAVNSTSSSYAFTSSLSTTASYVAPTASNGFRVQSDLVIDTGSLLLQSGSSFIKIIPDPGAAASPGMNKINSNNAPLAIQFSGFNRFIVSTSAVYPNDNTIDLGLAANQWKEFYLVGPQVLGTDLGGSDNMRISGSAKFSGPVTASAFSGSGAKITGVISSSYSLSSSYALSASWAPGSSGIIDTASYAYTSSQAITASYILNAVSSSYSLSSSWFVPTASSGFVVGPAALGTSETLQVSGSTRFGGAVTVMSGSLTMTSSSILMTTGSISVISGTMSVTSGSILFSSGSHTFGISGDPNGGIKLGGFNASTAITTLYSSNTGKITLNGNNFFPVSNNTMVLGKTGFFYASVLSTNVVVGPGDLQTSDNLRVSGSGMFSGPVTASAGMMISGSVVFGRTAVNDTNYTVVTKDFLVGYTNLTAGRVVTLPTAVSPVGRRIIIKDESGAAGTSNITITGSVSGQSIDGATSKIINTNYGSVAVYNDGSNWFTY